MDIMDGSTRTNNDGEWTCSLVHIFVDPMPCPPAAPKTVRCPSLVNECDNDCTVVMDEETPDNLPASLASVVEVPGPPPPPLLDRQRVLPALRRLTIPTDDGSGKPMSPVLGTVRLLPVADGGGAVLLPPDLLSTSQDSGFSDASSDSAPPSTTDWGGLADVAEQEDEENTGAVHQAQSCLGILFSIQRSWVRPPPYHT